MRKKKSAKKQGNRGNNKTIPLKSEKKTKELLEFPCYFPIKIIGYAQDELRNAVITILQKYDPSFETSSIQSRISKQGNYRAITVTIYATSKEQLDNIYLELTQCEHVLMAL